MKKLITVILVLALLLPAGSFADLPDISGLTFDELVQLRDHLNIAIWGSQEWQEVKVPVGVWKVGEDIPAGKWNISAASDNADMGTFIVYCSNLEPSGMDGDAGGRVFYYQSIENEKSGEGWYPTSIDINLYKGMYLIVKEGPAMFKPFAGKPDLGFK